MLKSLAKNPDNRYQTAAEMRADLIRVHSGEAPDAPKVLTDADRTSFMASTGPMHQTPQTEQLPAHQPPDYGGRDRGGSVGRWAIAVAALVVLTVVVTIGINMIGGSSRDVQVPDVGNQTIGGCGGGAAERRLQDPQAARSPTRRCNRIT